jgi:hypothetical protein
MIGFARVFAVVVSIVLIGFGLWLATYGNEGEVWLVVIGLITALCGVAGIGVLFFERMRYHSGTAEGAPRTPDAPGGDHPDEPLDPRFRSTPEVFVDPTSGRTMRVFVDPATGERRYRVEG